MNREKETSRFRVRGDSGQEYIVIEYQTLVPMGHMQNAGATKPGLKRLITLDGSPVNPTDDPETFKILTTDEIVRKV
jgi:hypothetical protein